MERLIWAAAWILAATMITAIRMFGVGVPLKFVVVERVRLADIQKMQS